MRLGATSLNVTSRSRGGSVSTSQSYIISCSDAVDEGSSLNVTIYTTNVAVGNDIYWSTSNVTTSDSDISIRSGNEAIQADGTATFSIPIVADQVTENVPETFDLVIKIGSQLGTEVNRKRITVNDTSQSPPPTYSLSTSSVVNEGTTFTSTVTTNHVDDGTTLYWIISHGTTNSDDFSATQGEFTVNTTSGTNGSGTFDITVEADALTETQGSPNETFTIEVREDDYTGTLLLNSTVSINDTSLTPIYTINADGGATSVAEGTALQFNVTTTNVPTGTTLYWGVSSNAGDFTTSTGQETTDANGEATFSVTPDADLLTEGSETFTVSIYTTSARQDPKVTSNSITISDASITATYSMSAASPSVDEGSALTFTVTTAGVPNNTDLYWEITSGAGDFTTTQGIVNITGTYTSGSGTFTVTPEADLTTENQIETFDVTLYTNQARSIFAADVRGIQINDTSQTPTYTMALPTGFNGADEGSPTTITVNVDTTVNTTLYWSITNGAGEFSTTQGSVTINGTSTTFTVTPTADQTTENTAEYFDITLYDDGARSNQVDKLENILINDTSQDPPITYTMSVPQGTAAPEGSATTITVTATGLTNNTGTAYWKITANAGDFTTTQGTVNLSPSGNNAVGTFDVTPDADQLTENTEIFTVTLYDDSSYSANSAKTTIDIPINDTSQTRTYAIAPASSSVNEGSGLNFTVTTTNVPNTTNLYWVVNGVTPNLQNRDAADPNTDFVHSTGSFQINNNSHTFTVLIAADANSEMSGGEEFNVEIRTDPNDSNSVVATSSTVVINEPTFALTAPSLNVDEGSTLVHTVTTTNFGATNSGTLYWKITSNAGDFTITQNSINVVNGTASFDITPDEDQSNESAENFTVALYLDSNYTVGEELATLTSSINATTYALSVLGGHNSVDEGSSLTFNVDATNAYNTTVYWKIVPGSTSPITLSDFSSVTNGSVTIDSAGEATFTITADEDASTETYPNPEYFNVELHADSAMNGTPLAYINGLALNDTSRDPTYTISTSNAAVNEGSTITFTVTTTDVPDNTNLYYTVSGVGAHAAATADFSSSMSGTLNIQSNSDTFDVVVVADTTTEGAEHFAVSVWEENTHQTLLASFGDPNNPDDDNSNTAVVINDTSLSPAGWTMVSNNGTSEVDEGGSFRVDVTGTNIVGTPTPNWLIRAGNGSTVSQNNTTEFYGYTGTLSNLTQNGSNWTGYFDVFPRNDNTTEGDEIMYIDLYSDSSFSTQLTSIGPITVRDTSMAESATLSVSGSTAVDEGSTMTVDLVTTGYPNQTFYWEIIGDGSNPVNPASDFNNNHTGTVTTSNVTGQYGSASASFTVGPYADTLTDGTAEGFAIEIADNSSRSPVLHTLTGLTVNDTSQAPQTTFVWQYHAWGSYIGPMYVYWSDTVGNHTLLHTTPTTQTHTTASAAWSTITTNLPSGTTGRIAYVYQYPGSYTGDMAINGGMLNIAGGTPINLEHTTNSSAWRHAWGYSSISSALNAGSNINYYLSTGGNVGRWNLHSGATGSAGTGPSAAPSGNVNDYYTYFESSTGGAPSTYAIVRTAAGYQIP